MEGAGEGRLPAPPGILTHQAGEDGKGGVCEQDYRPVTCAFVRMGVGRRTVSFYR